MTLDGLKMNKLKLKMDQKSELNKSALNWFEIDQEVLPVSAEKLKLTIL